MVWLLTGVWHGASWNYVLWGVYYGILLLIEKFALRRVLSKLPSFVQSVYTLFFVILGWVIFKCEDLSYCLSYLRAMFGGFGAGFLNGESLYLLKNYGIMLLILMVGSTMLPKRAADKVLAKIGNVSITGTAVRCLWFAGIFLISVAYLVDATYNPFLYFRF